MKPPDAFCCDYVINRTDWRITLLSNEKLSLRLIDDLPIPHPLMSVYILNAASGGKTGPDLFLQ
jgi:hypothetical protein